MVSVCLPEPWSNNFCQNDNPGGDVVSDTGAGYDMQGCREDIRCIRYVRSCCVESSVSIAHTLQVRSISSDQNVYSMCGRLELGYIHSKQVSEDADYVINGDTRDCCDLSVLR